MESPASNIADVGVHGSNGEGGAGQEEPATGRQVSPNAHVHCKLELSTHKRVEDFEWTEL